MRTDLILGTAGHIDHGKTSLIRALTGVDTDRLPEEKKRGITIDLGFAELRVGPFRLGIVDVPGHERFVRNMLAGATGMDLALLVVAADDSIKPQTREHLDILRLLDLKCGVVAITKCDLAEADWIELVEQEVRDLVADTFLQGAPIVRTSASTGMGMGLLRQALEQAAHGSVEPSARHVSPAPFRMAIDRAFTIPGHGTVVTGSVCSGAARCGDELVIEPGGLAVRVRGLQNHDRPADEVHRGQRAAINLAGVHHEGIDRGHELASPGHLSPSRRMAARIRAVASLSRPIRNRCRVRVHVGTAELLATLVLLDTDQVAPGQSAFAQLFLSGMAVTTWHQPLVMRSESPMRTIGGGQILVPQCERLPRHDSPTLGALADLLVPDPVTRASAALFFAGFSGTPLRGAGRGPKLPPGDEVSPRDAHAPGSPSGTECGTTMPRQRQPQDLSRTAGIEQTESVLAVLRSRGTLIDVALSPSRTLSLHRDCLTQLTQRIAKTLEKLHARQPLRTSIDRSQLRQGFDYVEEPVFDLALAQMRDEGRIRVAATGIALDGHGPRLSQNERKLLAKLIADYQAAGLEPPTVQQWQQQTARNQRSVPDLIALAAANGDLVQITAEYYLHREVDQQCRRALAGSLAAGPGLTVSQIREILNTSRKYAVPYCEYLDRTGFTRREGDLRMLGTCWDGGHPSGGPPPPAGT